METIEEYTSVEYQSPDELSYKDNQDNFVELYVNEKLIGKIEVWTDRENENREYICLNYEIVYLDTLTQL